MTRAIWARVGAILLKPSNKWATQQARYMPLETIAP
jgi:hypothetical protein